MALKKPFNFLKNAFRNLYFLMFLNGFLLASLFYFKMEAAYENGLFASIKTSIDSKVDDNDTQDSIVIKAMNACSMLMTDRAATFKNGGKLGLQSDFFHPASVDLMTAEGACGSYSEVLARILQTYDYPIRIASARNHLSLVKFLLTIPSINPTALDNYPLRISSSKEHFEVVKALLLDSRVNPIPQDIAKFGDIVPLPQLVPFILQHPKYNRTLEHCLQILKGKDSHVYLFSDLWYIVIRNLILSEMKRLELY